MPSLYVIGGNWGITGYNGEEKETLTINGFEVVVSGCEDCAVGDFRSISCKWKSELIAPFGHKVGLHNGNAAVVDAEGNLAKGPDSVIFGVIKPDDNGFYTLTDLTTLIEKIKRNNLYASLLPVMVDKLLHE